MRAGNSYIMRENYVSCYFMIAMDRISTEKWLDYVSCVVFCSYFDAEICFPSKLLKFLQGRLGINSF